MLPALLLLLLTAPAVRAQLSPGKLAQGHAHLEGLDNCAKCHSNNVRSAADPMLCRKCHDAIDVRMRKGLGLHGKEKLDNCGKCHSDHLGRNFNLIQWKTMGEPREKFRHERTGYRLEGAHGKVKCADCHQPKFIKDSLILREKVEFRKKTLLGLGTECLACHEDTHGKMFAEKKCLDCHDMEKWKPAKGFNHDKDTRFGLRGKHVALKCADCHKGGQPWELPPGKRVRDNGCITCHQDIHKGQFGRNCAKCHQEEDFKKVKMDGFDHSRTKFPLEGKHAEVNCNQCHKNGDSWILTRYQRCVDCHADFHKGEFTKTQRPERCEDCHSVQGFVPADFGVKEHARTDFPLKEAHLAVPCAACHTTTVEA
ncbi:MAG TPA: cytochrome c3 family protein, partial [Fibrobacteria bacterium]|nr:cytochrome c3 family protein [Fibrobacteria bacterium]